MHASDKDIACQIFFFNFVLSVSLKLVLLEPKSVAKC
jgi:hypothetical protein